MKNILIIIVLFTFTFYSATSQKWELIESDFTFSVNNRNYNLHLNKMLTLNGVFYALNTNLRTGLVKSTDKGISWDTCVFAPYDYLGTGTRFYDLVKHNNSLFIPADSGRIYHSFDGGDTWDFTYLGDEHKHPIQHLKFVNDSVGFVGHIQKSGFLKTTDAGRTWNQLPDASNTFPAIFALKNFVPTDENNIYFVGKWTGEYYFFKTTNSGKKWEQFNAGLFKESEYTNQEYSHLNYIEPYFFVESRFKPGPKGNTSIMRSKDFISWKPVFVSDTVGVGKFIHDIQYFEDFAIGLGQKIFIYSLDNGNTWVDLYDESDEFYSRNNPINGFIYSDGYVYAQGSILEKDEEGINHSIPKLYKFRFDIHTSIESESSNLNIYPNPAKTEVNINIDKPISTIEIIDLNGKSLLKLNEMNHTSVQVIDIEFLMAGVYFIRINGNIYKRFVKE